MNLQEIILKKFKAAHPKANFKEISIITGIQRTRLYRIFAQDYDMYVHEFETLFNTLSKSIPADTLILSLYTEVSKAKRKENEVRV